MIHETLQAPNGVTSQTYRDFAQRKSARVKVQYVTDLDGNLASGRSTQRSFEVRDRVAPLDFNGYGALFAALLVIGLLFLWLKFGGSGALLAREPREETTKDAVPHNWRITRDDLDQDTRSLMARIAAMTDRTEALVYLLRYSLLAGAQATEVRLARSDTERSAMARLPRTWPHRDALSTLLVKAELAHYGGRPVSDSDFERAMEIGRTILRGKRHV